MGRNRFFLRLVLCAVCMPLLLTLSYSSTLSSMMGEKGTFAARRGVRK